MQDFEKLGAFYLGKMHDVETGQTGDELLLYDAKDLMTHAVCVGMTGSGKTGLCLSLLEEAAIDGIPAIAVDPKGDLGNLLLTFPQLQPADFRPWIDEPEAARHGFTADQYAAQTATRWREGLAKWGQDGERIARLRAAVETVIYTPGSNAGLPLTVLRSFSAPPAGLLNNADAYRERVCSAASGLLALLGIEADPIRSREHILISNIFDHVWRAGFNLDIAALIGQIQSPPFEKVGVFDLETFFPPKDRLELAMNLNNLLASPAFAGWLEGEPLEVHRLLYAADGRPKLSIISIAHLSQSERMFFVTILLNEILAWVRLQPGASSLRALLYMDEVFGYFPPVANPPSKTPMLTLLKQARAFGLGIVLATQNPVDLDYKGLSNTGTWFLGRLQTERDKARVLEGLEGASAQAGAAFDRQKLEATLARLGSRVFLLNNVHEDHPVVFESRWAMSYLRGPLTRTQIETLMARYKEAAAAPPAGADKAAEPAATQRETLSAPVAPESARPLGPQGVDEFFLTSTAPVGDGQRLVYRPALLGVARLHFVSSTYHVDAWRQECLITTAGDAATEDVWDGAETAPPDVLQRLRGQAETDGGFAPLPGGMATGGNYADWRKKLALHLYRSQVCQIYRCAALKAYSQPGETEAAFRIRLAQQAREQRDLQVEKLRRRYASKLATLQERIHTAQKRVDEEKSQYRSSSLQAAISVGSTMLGALFGRKLASRTNVSRASTSARSVGRAADQRTDIKQAEEELARRQKELEKLEEQFQADAKQLETDLHTDRVLLEPLEIKPRKSDIVIEQLALLWRPWQVDDGGGAEPVFH